MSSDELFAPPGRSEALRSGRWADLAAGFRQSFVPPGLCGAAALLPACSTLGICSPRLALSYPCNTFGPPGLCVAPALQPAC